MSLLKLQFCLHLEPPGPPIMMRPSGPVFHRWLPDGEADAIQLSAENESDQVAVWLERRTVIKSGFLVSDRAGKEFDASIMARQGKLDGGNLFGRMTLSDLSDVELASLTKNPILLDQQFGSYDPSDPVYIKLARRIIAILHPKLARFMATLRNQYGQYWLEETPQWDSRSMTLGTYCSSVLGLLWRYEDRQVWCRLLPTPSGNTITAVRLSGRGYEEFLTEADWRRLQATRCLTDVSTEVQLLGQVTRSLEYREYAQAFVETISALELAMSNRLKAGSVTATIRSAIQRFEDSESIASQAAVVLLLLERPHHEIEQVLSAIKIRNAIVHEAHRPTESEAQMLRPVMQTIRVILGLDELKSPTIEPMNSLSPPAKN
jgi:hypothetical protein